MVNIQSFDNIASILTQTYDEQQMKLFNELKKRKEEIFKKIPKLEEIDKNIKKENVNFARKCLLLEKGFIFDEENRKKNVAIATLTQQKNELLEEHGYDKNYLKINPNCLLCLDTGKRVIENEIKDCGCYIQKFFDLNLEKFVGTKKMKTETFDNFDENLYSNDVNEKKYKLAISPKQNIINARNIAINFIKNFDNPNQESLIFFGSVGTGKTFLLNCITNKLLEQGYTCCYKSEKNLNEILNGYKCKPLDATLETQNIKNEYENIFKSDLLILDDLGTDTVTESKCSNLLEILEKKQKIIISTNLTSYEAKKRYGERITSRLSGNFIHVQIIGEDLRKKN